MILVMLVIIVLGAVFYPPLRQMKDLTVRQYELEEEIRQDEEMLRHLRKKQERLLNDPRFVEKIAREELGLAKPGETVFRFVDDPAPYDGMRARQ